MAVMTVVGCAGGEKIEDKLERYAAQNERQMEVMALNQQLFAGGNLNADPGDLLLGQGDLLQVTVFEAEELGTEVRVSSRGYITLPLLGQVAVKDLTARQAEIMIEDLYRAKYIKDPHVSIFIKENFSQRITMVGELKDPGTYDYTSKLRLMDVLVLDL